MPVRVQTNYHKYPAAIKQHLVERIRDRRFLPGMAQELADWLQTRPAAPDLTESRLGWYKKFSSFTVCGEGEFVKTIFTIYSQGTPRRGSVNLDQWKPPLRVER
jgi:hypothetical protein